MSLELAIPFRVGGDGRPDTVSNPDSQVRQHVFALVNTSPTERVTVPGYGVNLTPLLFEDMDREDIAAQASTLVQDAFKVWEPGVRLDDISVVGDEGDEDSQTVIDVRYSRRDSADSGTASNTNTAVIGAGGVVREVVRG